MRLILALLACLLVLTLLSGCATATVKARYGPDGKIQECEGSYASLFRDTDTTNLKACGAAGGSTGGKVNADLLKALLSAAMAP